MGQNGKLLVLVCFLTDFSIFPLLFTPSPYPSLFSEFYKRNREQKASLGYVFEQHMTEFHEAGRLIHEQYGLLIRGGAYASTVDEATFGLSLRKSQQFQHDPANLAARARERMEFEAAAEAVTQGKWGKESQSFSQQILGASAGRGLQFTSGGTEASSSAPSHKVTVHDRKRDVLRAMQRILTPRKSKFDSNNEDSTEESIRTGILSKRWRHLWTQLPNLVFEYNVNDEDRIYVICWKNLRTLAITFGRFDDDLFRSIISGSPVLETLVLDSCYGFEVLDISNDSVKNFVICGYSSEMDTLRINAPHIESLTIKDVIKSVAETINYEDQDVEKTPVSSSDKKRGRPRKQSYLGNVKDGDIIFHQVLASLKSKGFICPLNLKVLEEIDLN
ncbi:ubiquitin-activating enzyme E1 1-like protein isoform X2 [Tanacetum coccineum]|uniref:Ubiquitin-activating enzyme E1 1-like protein isoform X2 n=1 Tax=Tanacetum coccineum TaxID=301880 RepID=A0ABQ5FI09_9ASTR